MNYFVSRFDFCDEYSRNTTYPASFSTTPHPKTTLHTLKYFYSHPYHNVNSFNLYSKLSCKRFYYTYLLTESVHTKCKRKTDDFFYDNIVVYFDAYFTLSISEKMWSVNSVNNKLILYNIFIMSYFLPEYIFSPVISISFFIVHYLFV